MKDLRFPITMLLLIAGALVAAREHRRFEAHAERRLERIEAVELEQRDLLDDHAILINECDGLRADLGDALEGCTAALGHCDRLLRDTEEPKGDDDAR